MLLLVIAEEHVPVVDLTVAFQHAHGAQATRTSRCEQASASTETNPSGKRLGHMEGSRPREQAKEGSTLMQAKLELIPIPVSDVDRAIDFYADKLGFKKDFDVQPSDGVRIVQLTPEGSGCSVGFGTGLDVYAAEPGSVRGLHLVVEDIAEARAELVRRGVEVGEIQDFGGGVKGADLADPDGNTLELQEMAWRKGTKF